MGRMSWTLCVGLWSGKTVSLIRSGPGITPRSKELLLIGTQMGTLLAPL